MLHLFIPVTYAVLHFNQVPLMYHYCVVYIVYNRTYEEELMDTAGEEDFWVTELAANFTCNWVNSRKDMYR